MFEGDLLIECTKDGGDIVIHDNFFQSTQSLETAIYLSLFGGNYGNNGTEATTNNVWWGDQLSTNEPNEYLVSKTQNIIWGESAHPTHIRKLELSIQDDLAWMVSSGIAKSTEVLVSIPTRNRINIEIRVVMPNNTSTTYILEENWKGGE